MMSRFVVVAIAAMILSVCGRASAADVAAGKALAEGCAPCHGANGVSQTSLTPSLGGQSDEFVQWQLVYFRSGVRKSEVMNPIAGALSNEDIRNLGAYYASLPPPKPAAATDALAEQGESLRFRTAASLVTATTTMVSAPRRGSPASAKMFCSRRWATINPAPA